MKSKPLTTQIRDPKFGHSAPSLSRLADVDIAHRGEFPGLHMQVAIGQAGRRLHLHKRNREPGNERSQDTEATRGADHFVEVKVHGLLNFISQSILPQLTPCQALFGNIAEITLFYEAV